MSDLLSQDAIISAALLKTCAMCGHPRGTYQQDQQCTVKGYMCQNSASRLD